MIKRGSLKQCVRTMADAFAHYQYQLLSIIHNPRGKYYVLMTEADLAAYQERYMADRTRLVCTLSLKEFRHFTQTDQTDMFIRGGDSETQDHQQER